MVNDSLVSKNIEYLKALSPQVGGWVFATYSVVCSNIAELGTAAESIAFGQTLGFKPSDLKKYEFYFGRVFHSELKSDGVGTVQIAYPASLFGTDLSGMLTVLFGKVSFTPGIKLTDVEFDATFKSRFTGPKIGSRGIFDFVKSTSGKPPLMAILKPGLGVSDAQIADHFEELYQAGVSIIKDDEVRIDPSIDDALKRLHEVLNKNCKDSLYVVSLTGRGDQIVQNALRLQSHGASALLFCPYTYGFSLLQSLLECSTRKIPVFVHPAFCGAMSGIDTKVVLGPLLRLVGADAVLYPSPYGKIALELGEAKAIHLALSEQDRGFRSSLSIPSAGIKPEFVKRMRSDFVENIAVNAGTGLSQSGKSVAHAAKEFCDEINTHF